MHSMHLLVIGLGSSFRLPVSSFPHLSQYLVTKLRTTPLNEEIAVHELWQQKVKHIMKELNSR